MSNPWQLVPVPLLTMDSLLANNAFGNIAGWLFHPLAACLGLGVLAGGCARLPATGLHCDNLRCEYLHDPLGIDAASPRLSWIPASNMARIAESGKPVAKAEEVKFLRQENGKVVFEVGSGTYDFASKLDRP